MEALEILSFTVFLKMKRIIEKMASKRLYDKISDERKFELIRQVEIFGVKLCRASRSQGINYHSAKHILRQYRIQ